MPKNSLIPLVLKSVLAPMLAVIHPVSAVAQIGLETVAQTGTTSNGVTVDYAAYPLPAYVGRPWSQWGKGLVASNGKVYSAVGDHLGVNGNSYIYVYDPRTKVLRLTADLQSAVQGFLPTDYGFGKVHGRINQGVDGFLYFASYWGTTQADANYVGDRFFRYDPSTDALTDLGIPAQGHGYPSTNMWSAGMMLYAEAFEKQTDPYVVRFLAYDVATQQVTFFGGHEGTNYGRAFFVDAAGNAYFNNGARRLVKYDPRTNELTTLASTMPGAHLRQRHPAGRQRRDVCHGGGHAAAFPFRSGDGCIHDDHRAAERHGGHGPGSHRPLPILYAGLAQPVRQQRADPARSQHW